MSRLNTILIPLALALVACDPSVEVQVEVLVPAALQEGISEEAPQQVILEMSDPELGGLWLMGTLCQDAGEDIIVRWWASEIGCAEPGIARAWLVPVVEDAGGVVACSGDELGDTGQSSREMSQMTPSEADPTGQAPYMQDVGDGCVGASEEIRIELAAPVR